MSRSSCSSCSTQANRDRDQVDCGDIPISPYDNALAIDQIETAYSTLLARPVATEWAEEMGGMKKISLDGKEHPRIVTLGGDHTLVQSSQLWGP